MYCEKCKRHFPKITDKVCPSCGGVLLSAVDQTQNNELLDAIEQLKQGNKESFSVIYNYTYRYVYSRAKAMCDNPEDVADVVQEVYVALVQNASSLHSNESIFAWLRTVTFHTGSRVLKKKKHETLLTEENEAWLESLPDESEDAENDFVNQQDIEIIRNCINRLPDELRTVILAHYYDNLKVEEIAQLLDVPVGTVKSRLFAARKKIKQYVEAEEHRLGYKLHSFSAVSLLMAIRSLLQENMVGSEVQQATMYTHICSELNLSAGRGAASVSTVVEGTTPTTAVAKTVVGGIFKRAIFLNACKTVVVVVCGVAVIGTATFAGERLIHKQNTPTSNDILVNRTTETTAQALDSETSNTSSLNATYTSAIAPTTTTTVATTTTFKTSVKKTSPVTQSTSVSNCMHGDYEKDYSCLVLGWSKKLPGVENRYELHNWDPCTSEWHTIYKCPECLRPVLYSTRPPIGHDFSGEDVVLLYPNLNQEGSYGKVCQRENCNEKLLTTLIPKRSGDYSGIDSAFTVKIGNFQLEQYCMENPPITITDERTWGSVPTITYDAETGTGTISFLNPSGDMVWEHDYYVNWDAINEGRKLAVTIREGGFIEQYHWKLNFGGSSS